MRETPLQRQLLQIVITAFSFYTLVMVKNLREPYIQINGILTILILCIFLYSYFYPLLANQGMALPSSCEGLPEIVCRSRGLSRAFAQMMHGNVEKAISFNKYAVTVFSFFVTQFFARILFSFRYWKVPSQKLIILDSVFSVIYFSYTFFPFTFLSNLN